MEKKRHSIEVRTADNGSTLWDSASDLRSPLLRVLRPLAITNNEDVGRTNKFLRLPPIAELILKIERNDVTVERDR
jgi:hypothetical protein